MELIAWSMLYESLLYDMVRIGTGIDAILANTMLYESLLYQMRCDIGVCSSHTIYVV